MASVRMQGLGLGLELGLGFYLWLVLGPFWSTHFGRFTVSFDSEVF